MTRHSGQLSQPLCQKEPLSSDRTLTCVRSALTGRVWSRKTLSGTLLMLTERWHPEFGHFAVQRPVSYRILTSVRSALIGRVRSGISLSRTSLELIGLWHPAFGHFSLSVRSQPDDSSWSNELTGLTLQHPVTTRPAFGLSFDPPFTFNSKSYVNEVCSN